ncbi:thiamine diphosphokinase [Armatimonas sp.]|uniref:thiamine diphosphokinase n=1 Tax=Armatimonas sp. TaxID=1872638 RepID=UPI00286C9B35|nr:thiamine diphosphokinase [Armatimonas sp.]
MHAVLCANAPFSGEAEELLQEAVARADILLGVDGGARTLQRYGLIPHIITGDGDSLSDDERAVLVRAGAKLVPTPDQDYTDLDKALTYVREEWGATKVTVFGATGGRLDHSYSVFSALIKHGRSLSLQLVDETAMYELVVGEWQRSGSDLVGRPLSLLAFGRVEGITTKGVRWPLTNDWLAPGLRDGTLNEVTEDSVTVAVASGELIVMLHHI